MRASSAAALAATGFAFGLTLVCSSQLSAQRVESIDRRGVHRDTATTYRSTSPLRFFTSTGGAIVGLLAGAMVGEKLPHHNCGCDDPGLDEIIYGALVGATIGAAIGTALPNMRSVCSSNVRLGRSFIGAGIGASAGFILGGGLGKDGASVLSTPAGAIGGSLIGLGRCWRSHFQ